MVKNFLLTVLASVAVFAATLCILTAASTFINFMLYGHF